MIALFARADHPEGYGMGKTAHGYVVLMVRCKSQEQVGEVIERLKEPFHGLHADQYGHGLLGEWYGGKFDFLAVIPDGTYADTGTVMTGKWNRGGRFVSKGDNRFVGLFEAKEVLKS